MRPSEILKKAAQFVEQERVNFSCHAFDELGYCCENLEHFQLLRPTYGEQFAMMAEHSAKTLCMGDATLVRNGDAWWGCSQRDERIIGLCLAAAIAESEGK